MTDSIVSFQKKFKQKQIENSVVEQLPIIEELGEKRKKRMKELSKIASNSNSSKSCESRKKKLISKNEKTKACFKFGKKKDEITKRKTNDSDDLQKKKNKSISEFMKKGFEEQNSTIHFRKSLEQMNKSISEDFSFEEDEKNPSNSKKNGKKGLKAKEVELNDSIFVESAEKRRYFHESGGILETLYNNDMPSGLKLNANIANKKINDIISFDQLLGINSNKKKRESSSKDKAAENQEESISKSKSEEEIEMEKERHGQEYMPLNQENETQSEEMESEIEEKQQENEIREEQEESVDNKGEDVQKENEEERDTDRQDNHGQNDREESYVEEVVEQDQEDAASESQSTKTDIETCNQIKIQEYEASIDSGNSEKINENIIPDSFQEKNHVNKVKVMNLNIIHPMINESSNMDLIGYDENLKMPIIEPPKKTPKSFIPTELSTIDSTNHSQIVVSRYEQELMKDFSEIFCLDDVVSFYMFPLERQERKDFQQILKMLSNTKRKKKTVTCRKTVKKNKEIISINSEDERPNKLDTGFYRTILPSTSRPKKQNNIHKKKVVSKAPFKKVKTGSKKLKLKSIRVSVTPNKEKIYIKRNKSIPAKINGKRKKKKRTLGKRDNKEFKNSSTNRQHSRRPFMINYPFGKESFNPDFLKEVQRDHKIRKPQRLHYKINNSFGNILFGKMRTKDGKFK